MTCQLDDVSVGGEIEQKSKVLGGVQRTGVELVDAFPTCFHGTKNLHLDETALIYLANDNITLYWKLAPLSYPQSCLLYRSR